MLSNDNGQSNCRAGEKSEARDSSSRAHARSPGCDVMSIMEIRISFGSSKSAEDEPVGTYDEAEHEGLSKY